MYNTNPIFCASCSLESESHPVMPDSLWPHGLYSPCSSPGQNTGVSSLSLLQGIFPIQGSKPGLPHCRCILYQLSHKGSPRILEWVAYPFSRGSSQPRNQTGVSSLASSFYNNSYQESPSCSLGCHIKQRPRSLNKQTKSISWKGRILIIRMTKVFPGLMISTLMPPGTQMEIIEREEGFFLFQDLQRWENPELRL